MSGMTTVASQAQTSTGLTTIQSGAELHDVIKVDSDDSEDELHESPLPKRARTSQYRVTPPTTAGGSLGDSDDSEHDYDALYHGLDPGSTNNWKDNVRPDSPPSQVLPQHDVTAQPPTVRGSHTPKIVHGLAVEPEYIPPPPSLAMRKDFIWAAALLRQKPVPCKPMNRKQNHLGHQPSVVLGLASLSASFAKAGGAIHKIIQNPGCIAISSAAAGGQPDNQGAAEQPIDPYNHEGTLQIWQESKEQNSTILHGHCLFEDQSEMPTCCKCYTVNSISFDPNQSQVMASAGNNGSVQLWLDGKKLVNDEYPRAPYDVVYRKKDSLLAVTCTNGFVYVHSTQSGMPFGDPIDLRVTPPDVQQSVGSVVWGHGASADMLFASSEAQRADDYSGFHVAFDPGQRRRAYNFSAGESGDAMALDPDGERLALCTAGPESGVHSLRIYDVRRRNGQRPIQEVQLDIFDSGLPEPASRDDEVTAASFSPDGILLAVARSDDELHIYDSRFMGRSGEPMARYLHWDNDCCVGDKWGIVDAVWVNGWCGKGFGIITGGADGCVRFWDIRRSAEDVQNGEVLARPNVDVGHFSVGDPRNGEKPLVVGDNDGRVYVYDYAAGASRSVV
ncbi:WD40-repeat-containing domain protein [Lactarius psammicola]|nr:WD40-repeat-containing domain protein [Lactarius psammicola]